MKQVTAHVGYERIGHPSLTRRHDVEMPGKGEVRTGIVTPCREQVFDGPIGLLADDKAFDIEALGDQRGREHIKHRASRRRDAGGGNE